MVERMKEKDREKPVNWEIILELVVKDTDSEYDNRDEERMKLQVSKQNQQ